MDVRALLFEDASFDIAIDKGGVILHGISPGLAQTHLAKEPWMR